MRRSLLAHGLTLSLGVALCLASPDLLANEKVTASRLPEIPSEYLLHEGDGIRVAYHPGTRERVRALLPRLGSIRDELSSLLGHAVLDDFEIRVGALPIDLRRLTPPGYENDENSAVFDERVLVVHADHERSSADLERLISAQLATMALRQAQGPVPQWYARGFADHFSDGALSQAARTVEQVTLHGVAPALADFESGPRNDKSGVLASDFLRFMAEDPSRLVAVTDARRRGESFEQAMLGAFGGQVDAVERAWRKDVAERHAFIPLLLFGLLIWICLATIARVRRRSRGEEEKRTITRRTGGRPRSSRLRNQLQSAVLADREGIVPRIEHDGRWHTLH